jgi:peptide deformylase
LEETTVALLSMRFLPDPILRRQARKIGKVPANMKKFTDDMIETMRDELGVGLAANQIGSLQKVAVIQLPDWEEAIVLINPEIVSREGEREVVEGCLSIPGYRGLVKRSVNVRARAIGLDGKVIRIKADGLLAQALEHETGHLQGSLYIDHLVTSDDLWKIPQGGEEEEEEEESGEDNGNEAGSTGHSHEPGEESE